MPFRSEKKSHVHRTEILLKGPIDPAAFRRFRAAIQAAAKKVKGRVRETKPSKEQGRKRR
jgi:hypothetical protein